MDFGVILGLARGVLIVGRVRGGSRTKETEKEIGIMEEAHPKMMDANEAYRVYHVTRAWLREKRGAGIIRGSSITGCGVGGRQYIRNLYSVGDIERALSM